MKTLFIFVLSAFYATSGQPTTSKVYTSQNGKKYHTHQDCQYIKGHDNVKAITLAEANKQGMTLCSRCKAKDEKKGGNK